MHANEMTLKSQAWNINEVLNVENKPVPLIDFASQSN